MESNNGNKLASFLLAGALLLSGLLVFPTAAGNPGPDLWLSDFYEPAGSPPPRADTLYEVYLAWENSGDADANGVRIGIDDEDGNQMAISDYINMGAGETGSLTLNITFDSVGETMPVAIVDYDETVSEDDEDNNEYEGWFNVEPKIGIADVWADLDIEDTEAQAGQQMLLRFSIGNSGNVSTATPVTLGLFFEEAGDEPQNWIDPTPLHYDYIQPPPPGEEGGEMMEFEWQVPQDTDDGWYEFTVIADYYENNTEDNNISNNRDTHEICIGDCTLPDLTWYEAAQESITLSPPEAIAGEVVTVIYALANIGEGAAGPPAIVINLEVEKCPCDGSGWQQVNTTGDLRVTIGAGQTFSSEEELGLNWSIPEDGPGDWDLRIVIDPDNNLEEAREDNNNLTWYDAHEDYLEVIERKPDLRVAGVSTPGQAYAGDTIDLDLHIQQSELGNKMATDTNVRLRITDPELQEYGPYTLGPLDVGIFPDIIFFTFEWDIPLNCGGSACIGDYTLEIMVDPGNEIDEWDETNNLRNDLSINVKEMLPDLIVSDVVITPVDEDGSAAVGVASTITAVVSNIGLRDMSPGEGADFEVTFSTAAPSYSVIGTTAVGIALAIGESANVSIGYIFTDLGTYKVVAEADAADDINEMDESNNEAYDILPAVTSIDGWVQNVTTTDGLSGKNHPLSFEIGFNNLPASGWQYLFFRVTVEGTGGWGDVLQLEAGENFLVSPEKPSGEPSDWRPENWSSAIFMPNTAYVNLTAANPNANITVNWVPDKDRSDNYTITIKVFAMIDTDEDNNAATTTANIEKLTTDLLIEKMSVKDTASSVQIIVDVLFVEGEQSTLWDVEVSLKVYDWDDYAADSDAAVPRENLGTKTINGGLSRGSSWSLTFTWAREKGEFIFVAEVDPNNKVREINEVNNVYASDVEEFGDVSTGGTDNGGEDDGGLFGIPSISGIAALSLLGTVALLRRRR